MKAVELRELSAAELEEKINGYEEELFNFRFQARMGQLSNALQLRILRRETARAKTVLREKQKEAAAEKAQSQG